MALYSKNIQFHFLKNQSLQFKINIKLSKIKAGIKSQKLKSTFFLMQANLKKKTKAIKSSEILSLMKIPILILNIA
jgi:hypothetical protein